MPRSVGKLYPPERPTTRPCGCDLLLALDEALMPAGDSLQVYESGAPEAFPLAQTLGDDDRVSLACWLAVEAVQLWSHDA